MQFLEFITATYTILMTIWTRGLGHTYLEHAVLQQFSFLPFTTTGFGPF